MSRASNNDAVTRRPPSATELMDTKSLLGGGFVQGESGSGKTALLVEVARSILATERESPQPERPARQPGITPWKAGECGLC